MRKSCSGTASSMASICGAPRRYTWSRFPGCRGMPRMWRIQRHAVCAHAALW